MTAVGKVPSRRTVVLEMLGLVPGQIGGMETYARNLARMLPALDVRYRYLAVVGTEAWDLIANGGGPLEGWVADSALPAWTRRVRPVRTLLQSAALARQLRHWAPDLLHCTLMFPKPPWGARNMVVTIPDLNFELLPDCWRPLDRRLMSLTCRLATHLAKAVITFSQFSKRTLVTAYHVPPDRVHVTPLGVDARVFAPPADPDEVAALRRDLDLPLEFLLFPANTWPHKNHIRVLEALVALRDADGLRPCLVLTGSPKHGHPAVMDALARLGLRDQVRWLGYVDGERLVALYRAATALVFPSLHEGFGLPVLEAMACGCPVACSRTTATVEAAGDVDVAFDPGDVSDIARALRALLKHDSLRRDLARRGLRRATVFSWVRTAADTRCVYDEVISRGHGGGG
jgi:glycosyltransferase involved in cell wall biosynthesis